MNGAKLPILDGPEFGSYIGPYRPIWIKMPPVRTEHCSVLTGDR